MGTGIWANFHWESEIWVTGTGIWSLGMGITDRKTIELGLGFFKIWKNNRLGNEIWAKFGLGKWDLYPPFRTLFNGAYIIS